MIRAKWEKKKISSKNIPFSQLKNDTSSCFQSGSQNSRKLKCHAIHSWPALLWLKLKYLPRFLVGNFSRLERSSWHQHLKTDSGRAPGLPVIIRATLVVNDEYTSLLSIMESNTLIKQLPRESGPAPSISQSRRGGVGSQDCRNHSPDPFSQKNRAAVGSPS